MAMPIHTDTTGGEDDSCLAAGRTYRDTSILLNQALTGRDLAPDRRSGTLDP